MVGAILVAGAAMCAGGASRAAPTIGGFLDAAGFALAAEGDGGFSLAPTAGEWFAADGLAIRTPGIDDDGLPRPERRRRRGHRNRTRARRPHG